MDYHPYFYAILSLVGIVYSIVAVVVLGKHELKRSASGVYLRLLFFNQLFSNVLVFNDSLPAVVGAGYSSPTDATWLHLYGCSQVVSYWLVAFIGLQTVLLVRHPAHVLGRNAATWTTSVTVAGFMVLLHPAFLQEPVHYYIVLGVGFFLPFVALLVLVSSAMCIILCFKSSEGVMCVRDEAKMMLTVSTSFLVVIFIEVALMWLSFSERIFTTREPLRAYLSLLCTDVMFLGLVASPAFRFHLRNACAPR